MKIVALSPFCSAPCAEILEFIQKTRCALMVLPGSSKNTPSPQQLQRLLRRGMMVFVEGKKGYKKNRIPYLVTSNAITKMPGQVFGKAPSAREMHTLAVNWPKRTISVGSRKITFA